MPEGNSEGDRLIGMTDQRDRLEERSGNECNLVTTKQGRNLMDGKWVFRIKAVLKGRSSDTKLAVAHGGSGHQP